MIEISRLLAVLGTLIGSGGRHKIAMAEVTLKAGEDGLIVFATGTGAKLAKAALESASPKPFEDYRIPNHAEN